MSDGVHITRPARSVLLTATGWSFFGIGALGMVFFLLFTFVFGILPFDRIMLESQAQLMKDGMHPAPMPPISLWFMHHMTTVFGSMAGWCVIHALAGLGLLWRRRVGRILTVTLLAIDGVWLLFYVGVQAYYFQDSMDYQRSMMPPGDAELLYPMIRGFALGEMIGSLLGGVVFVVAVGWLIRKLQAPAISAELR